MSVPLRALLLLLPLSFLFGQFVMVTPEKEPVGTPKAKAEPIRKLSRAPQALFEDLLSPTTAVRARALNEMTGSQWTEEDASLSDATLRAVNLDEDPDIEYVFTVHTTWPEASFVILADHRSDGWYAVGRFVYSYHWNAEDAERFLEVHAPFLLIRSFGGGTGGISTESRVYRLWKGALYETLNFTEHFYVWTARAPGVASEETHRSIVFHPGGISSETALQVRTETRTTFRSSRKAETNRSCDGYRWSSATFSFQSNKQATQTLCRPSSR